MQFVIPTIFSARNDMAPVMHRINQDMNEMRGNAIMTGNSFKNLAGSMMSYAGVAGVIGAVASGLIYAGKSLMDYERELANLKALTGVTGQQFEQFRTIIQSTALESKTSSVEVAKGFTVVANAMPELLQSAEGLGMVTSASILLAKAARMELTPAAEAVTTILNQFGQGAKDAARLVDLMAAGSKYGSAEIEDLSLSLREFAAQARLANVSMTESIAVTELVSKFRKGTQAGVELRNVLLYLDTIKGQDPKAIKDLMRLGVNLNLVADKTVPLSTRLIELSKISKDSAALFHVFGKENEAMAANVLQHAQDLEPFILKLQETGVAAKMADENTKPLWIALQQMAGKFVTLMTASEGSNMALAMTSDLVRFVTDNMGGLLNIIVPAIAAWATFSTAALAAKGAMWLYNAATGIAAGLTSTLSGALMENAVAARAETFILQTRLNVLWQTITASRELMVLTGVGLVFVIAELAAQFSLVDTKAELVNDAMESMGKRFKEVKQGINEATAAQLAYNKAVDEYNEKMVAWSIHEYNKKNSPVSTFIDDMFHMRYGLKAVGSQGMILLPQNSADEKPIMPVLSGFYKNLADTSLLDRDAMGGHLPDTARTFAEGITTKGEKYEVDRSGNIHIVIDNKTNNQVDVGTNTSGIPTQVIQTGNYRAR